MWKSPSRLSSSVVFASSLRCQSYQTDPGPTDCAVSCRVYLTLTFTVQSNQGTPCASFVVCLESMWNKRGKNTLIYVVYTTEEEEKKTNISCPKPCWGTPVTLVAMDTILRKSKTKHESYLFVVHPCLIDSSMESDLYPFLFIHPCLFFHQIITFPALYNSIYITRTELLFWWAPLWVHFLLLLMSSRSFSCCFG